MTYRQLGEAWDYRGSIRTTHEDSSPWFPQETPPVLPDIVLVVRDDVGFADLGCFGSEIQTPHMDAVAAAPPFEHGSYRIEALASVPLEGVVIAYGNSNSGFVLYARSGGLVYEYNGASGWSSRPDWGSRTSTMPALASCSNRVPGGRAGGACSSTTGPGTGCTSHTYSSPSR